MFVSRGIFVLNERERERESASNIRIFLKINPNVTASYDQVSRVKHSKKHLTVTTIARNTHETRTFRRYLVLSRRNTVLEEDIPVEREREEIFVTPNVRCAASNDAARRRGHEKKKVTIERTLERSRTLRFSCRRWKKRGLRDAEANGEELLK